MSVHTKRKADRDSSIDEGALDDMDYPKSSGRRYANLYDAVAGTVE